MSELIGAASMTTIARQFRCSAGIVAVLATVFAILLRHAITGRMGTFFVVRHSGPPFYQSTASPRKCFSMGALYRPSSVSIKAELSSGIRAAIGPNVACAPSFDAVD